MELLLKHAIGVLSLLLLAELDTILRCLATLVKAMLSRGIVLLCEYLVFAEDGFAELTGDLGAGTCVSCHFC